MARKYKWEIFVDKVVGGMSQREAYKTTFDCKKMSDESIDSTASAMLNDPKKYPKISARYSELMKAAQEKDDNKAIADAQELLEYMTSVVRKQSKSYVLARDMTGSNRVIEKPPDEKEALRAAELMCKALGMFNTNVNLNGNIGVVIVDDIENEAD